MNVNISVCIGACSACNSVTNVWFNLYLQSRQQNIQKNVGCNVWLQPHITSICFVTKYSKSYTIQGFHYTNGMKCGVFTLPVMRIVIIQEKADKQNDKNKPRWILCRRYCNSLKMSRLKDSNWKENQSLKVMENTIETF